MDLRETYNLIADDWAKDHAADTWSAAAVDKFCSLLPGGAEILDVGCGPGFKAKEFDGRGFKVTGIDISERMVELAAELVPTADFKVLDVAALDTLKESFDAVFAQAILLHVSKNNCSQIISAMVRRLRFGGFLFVAVKEQRDGREEEEVVKENDYGYEYERFFSYFLLPEVLSLFEQEKLAVVFQDFIGPAGKRWIVVIGNKR